MPLSSDILVPPVVVIIHPTVTDGLRSAGRAFLFEEFVQELDFLVVLSLMVVAAVFDALDHPTEQVDGPEHEHHQYIEHDLKPSPKPVRMLDIHCSSSMVTVDFSVPLLPPLMIRRRLADARHVGVLATGVVVPLRRQDVVPAEVAGLDRGLARPDDAAHPLHGSS
jgi:hypothetical protein